MRLEIQLIVILKDLFLPLQGKTSGTWLQNLRQLLLCPQVLQSLYESKVQMALLPNCLSSHHIFHHSLPFLVHQVSPLPQVALACLACLTDTYHRLQRYGKSCRIYLPDTSVYTRCCKLLLSMSLRRIPACNLQ